MLRFLRGKAVRTVLRWQFVATVILAIIFWPWFGAPGTISALLGGSINMIAGIAFFAIAGADVKSSAGNAIRRMIRAEAGKIVVIVGALWFALSVFKGIAFVPFFAAFAATALLAGAALLVRDDPALVPPPNRR